MSFQYVIQANTQTRNHSILHNPQTTSGSTVSSSSSSLLQSQDFLRGVGVRVRVRDLVGVGVTPRSLLDPPDGTFTDFREVSVWDRLSSTRSVRCDSNRSLEPTFLSSATWRELPSLGFMQLYFFFFGAMPRLPQSRLVFSSKTSPNLAIASSGLLKTSYLQAKFDVPQRPQCLLTQYRSSVPLFVI